MSKVFYFTFGTRGQIFEGGHIKIYASGIKNAQELFINHYGNNAWKVKGKILNYAGHYSEDEWIKTEMQFGVCHEVIK